AHRPARDDLAGLPAIGCAARDKAGAGACAARPCVVITDQAQSCTEAAKLVERQIAGALTKTVGSTRCERELSAAQSAGRRGSARLKSSCSAASTSCSAALSSAVS